MFWGLFSKKRKAKEPEYLENDLGRFHKSYSKSRVLYEGGIDWCDKYFDVEVFIFCNDANQEIQNKNFEYLRRILENKVILDEKLKDDLADNEVEKDGLVHI